MLITVRKMIIKVYNSTTELPNIWVIASIILSVYPCVMLSWEGMVQTHNVILKMLCKYLILQVRGSTVLLYFLLSLTGSGSWKKPQ